MTSLNTATILLWEPYGKSCALLTVPLEQLDTILRIEPHELHKIRGEGVYRHNDRTIGVMDLRGFMGLEPADEDAQRYGMLVDAGEFSQMLLIDQLAGIHEVVVKSLGPHLRHVHGIAGATIGGDGRVVLILEIMELVGAVKSPALQKDSSRPDSTPKAIKLIDQRHVMVVDDSLSVRRVVSRFLERAGWAAVTARDGVDALEQIREQSPDVILLDIEMPRMNGYELLSILREDETLAGIPVVFLTSRSAPKHRERAQSLGADGYIVKPYREEELLDALDAAVRQRKGVLA